MLKKSSMRELGGASGAGPSRSALSLGLDILWYCRSGVSFVFWEDFGVGCRGCLQED